MVSEKLYELVVSLDVESDLGWWTGKVDMGFGEPRGGWRTTLILGQSSYVNREFAVSSGRKICVKVIQERL